MSYRRSYEILATKEKKEEFIKNVKEGIKKFGRHLHKNHYPYDRRQDEEVQTTHYTCRYKNIEDIKDVIKIYRDSGYTLIEQSVQHKSIPEINHIHFVTHVFSR